MKLPIIKTKQVSDFIGPWIRSKLEWLVGYPFQCTSNTVQNLPYVVKSLVSLNVIIQNLERPKSIKDFFTVILISDY